MDVAVNTTPGVAGAFNPIVGGVSVAVDLVGGGIHPVGDMFGTSTYWGVNDPNYQGPNLLSDSNAALTGLGDWMSGILGGTRQLRQMAKTSLGRGGLNSLFGRGGGQALAGRAGRGVTGLGIAASLAAGASDWHGCEKKCEQFKP